MTKKGKNKSKEKKKKPREQETAEKAGERADDNVSLADVKHCVKFLEEMISAMKNRGRKDQDQDHPEPSDPKETELLLKFEEELRFLKSKMADCKKEPQDLSKEQGSAEKKEIENVEKKDIEGLEDELVTLASRFEILTKSTVQRINEMNKYKDSGSADMEDLETIRLAGEQLKENKQNPDGLLARLMRDVINLPAVGKGNSYLSSQELKKLKKQVESGFSTIEAVEKHLDESEQKFRMYNLPKRDDHWAESLEQYLERVREFMKSWKEAAAKFRRKEHRSFLEWMVKLSQSENDERRVTFKALKTVFGDLGIQISRFLIEYFLLMSVSADEEEIAASLFEVESIIRCLIIEEISTVINNFVSVVEFFDRTRRMAKPVSDEKGKGKSKEIEEIKKDDLRIEKENDLLHLIIMEILRLEVSFSHPDLPMMLIDEVFLAMGKHLIDNVFEDKFNKISAKIYGLKSEFLSVQQKNSMGNFFEQLLDLGIKEIWNDLDMKPRAS